MSYKPSFSEFKQLSKEGRIVPVCKEILADFETPVSCFYKLAKTPYSYLLESVQGQEHLARFSFIGVQPWVKIWYASGSVKVEEEGELKEWKVEKDPLLSLRPILKEFSFSYRGAFPRFFGGAVGYICYEYIRYIEDIGEEKDCPFPLYFFLITWANIIFDHLKNTIKIVTYADTKKMKVEDAYQFCIERIENIIKRLDEPIKREEGFLNLPPFSSNFEKAQFLSSVMKAKEYIKRGDIYQVVLSQRFTSTLKDSPPFNIYRRLRQINPSPYMFYLDFDSIKLLGSSPELMVRVEAGDVMLCPIAGTRPRGENEKKDKERERELLSSEKERAEHIMLVDLGRNDIGRVCRWGSVHVEDFMRVERYSHVMHIVSSIRGRLAKGFDVFDALRATFPAGTVTGAPKIRAMQIINELEPEFRGPYAGVVCYFSFNGNLDSCIIIRSIIQREDKIYVQAGAGIVADSDPVAEYEETLAKAEALMKAAGQ